MHLAPPTVAVFPLAGPAPAARSLADAASSSSGGGPAPASPPAAYAAATRADAELPVNLLEDGE